MKKKLFVFTTLIALLAAVPLSGCHKVAGNYPSACFATFTETEDGFYSHGYEISLTEKTYRAVTAEERENYPYDDALPLGVETFGGGTAPRYVIEVPAGFEGVIPYIEAQEIDGNDSSVVDTYGIVSGDVLTGWVNVYKDTIGYLSGGGNYGAEEIDHAITFTYNATSGEFNVTNTIDDALIVSFYGDAVLYWKKKSYYSYNMASATETFLVKDKAYDSGIQHQSQGYIRTNGKLVLFEFYKAKLWSDATYFYIYDYADNSFYQLEEQ